MDWLTPAETQLIAACKAGEACTPGDGTCPPESPKKLSKRAQDLQIRAEVLRYLILGGCAFCTVDRTGVTLVGARITGPLDLSHLALPGGLRLTHCRFDHLIAMEQTRAAVIDLSDSHLAGVRAPGLALDGSLYLRNITSTQTIRLANGEIGGQLACTGARFEVTQGKALDAHALRTQGQVSLREVTARTIIDLDSARIGGRLSCHGARLSGTDGQAFSAQGMEVAGDAFLHDFKAVAPVRLTGAHIRGQLSCIGAQFMATQGFALRADELRIEQKLVWSNVTFGPRPVDLRNAHVGGLSDDPEAWPEPGNLILDGFTYDRIIDAPVSARQRLAWVRRGDSFKGAFFPQPWSHLARVLNETGHEIDARKVLIARDRRMWAHRRAEMRDPGAQGRWHPRTLGRRLWAACINLPADLFLRWVAGYGHQPFRSVTWMGVLILAIWLPAHMAWQEGSFTPNAAPVLVSEGWRALAPELHAAAFWSGERTPPGTTPQTWAATAPGRDWETFAALTWAIDVVVPIIDFGQTDAWAPSTSRGPWGWHLWWGRWLGTALGWIVTALGAAAVTGLIRRE